MFGKRLPKNRTFSYEYKFYDPKEDEALKKRLNITRKTSRSAKRKSSIQLFVLLAMVIYILYFLSRLGKT